MNKVKFNEIEYEIIEDNKEAFDLEAVKHLYTDYFEGYDYVLGDWSYGKLRLKGFCEKSNKLFNRFNDYKTKSEYVNEICAYGCKYFVLKKVTK